MNRDFLSSNRIIPTEHGKTRLPHMPWKQTLPVLTEPPHSGNHKDHDSSYKNALNRSRHSRIKTSARIRAIDAEESPSDWKRKSRVFETCQVKEDEGDGKPQDDHRPDRIGNPEAIPFQLHQQE